MQVSDPVRCVQIICFQHTCVRLGFEMAHGTFGIQHVQSSRSDACSQTGSNVLPCFSCAHQEQCTQHREDFHKATLYCLTAEMLESLPLFATASRFWLSTCLSAWTEQNTAGVWLSASRHANCAADTVVFSVHSKYQHASPLLVNP